jgi:AcrR family transcriptional regulator
MAEVAQRAGVSRQTLYNTFGTRLRLAQTYLGRESDRFLTAVDAAVRAHAAHPHQALAAALETFLTAAGQHPLVRALTTADGSEELLPLITTRGGPLIDRVTGHLAQLLLDTWPQLRRSDATPVADTLVRLAISHAALPAGEPRDTARTIARLLGPRVDQLLG